MKLFRDKILDRTEGVAKIRGGRSLWVYFVPIVVVSAILVAAVSTLVIQALDANQRDLAERSGRIVAATVADRVGGVLRAKHDLLSLKAREPGLATRFARESGGRPLVLTAADMAGLPGFVGARIFPLRWQNPLSDDALAVGFAGLDMIRKVARNAQPQRAEVHQISAGSPYIAMAVPIAEGGEIRAVLFGALSVDVIRRVLLVAPDFPGRIWVTQGGEAGYVLAQGASGGAVGGISGSFDIAGSIWKVNYAAQPRPHKLTSGFIVQSVMLGGVVAMVLTVVLMLRMLGRDLRRDQASIVTLGEAILAEQGAASPKPRLAANRDTLLLLAQYARDALASHKEPRRPGGGKEEQPEADLPPGEEVPPVGAMPPPKYRHAAAKTVRDVPQSLFRAYDVRGVVGQELTPELALLLGQAVGSMALRRKGPKVGVARDARVSSPELAQALIQGLEAAGCDVYDLGMVPTPILYFTLELAELDAGVIVTGSHNPVDYNGFKIVVDGMAIGGDELQEVRRMMLERDLEQGQGERHAFDAMPDYISAVVEQVQLARGMKVVVDAGNGAAGESASLVFRALGCEVVQLFCDPDGTFPNHHPDPSQPDNLASLVLEVEASEADLGIAFDGDGDRVGIVDNQGRTIWADQVLMLLAADVLVRHPGADILFDVKSSRHIAGYLLANGGRPIMWKSGHTKMKQKMRETGALLGGEFSGHFFIKERWYGFDDAIYAAARVLELLAADPRSSAEVFAELPRSPATPEIYVPVGEGESRGLMHSLAKHMQFGDAKIVDLDGIRVEFPEGWGLVRASNTTPSLMFRFEADSEAALEEIKSSFRKLLKDVAPELQAPF